MKTVTTFQICATLSLILFSQGSVAAEQPKEAYVFYNGADISMLTKIEEKGGDFKFDGKSTEFFEMMKQSKYNCFRLRLFVEPNYEGGVVNDLPYTLELAKRIKDAGNTFILDFHYSDTWADPGKQYKPKAWEGLNFEDLVQKIEDYTSSVILAFKEKEILPEIVQIGNEIRAGMIWPEGRVGNEEDKDQDKQWKQFTDMIKAGIRGVHKATGNSKQIKIMMHSDQGAHRGHTKWFFDNLHKHDIAYDMIGLSYYPWWHGTIEELRDNLTITVNDYGKDIFVAEIAYPYFDKGEWWNKEYGDKLEYPLTKEGQHDFMVDVISILHNLPDGKGRGILYWYPEAVPVKGLEVWNNGHTGLFDFEFNPLPALDAYQSFLNKSLTASQPAESSSTGN